MDIGRTEGIDAERNTNVDTRVGSRTACGDKTKFFVWTMFYPDLL